MDGPHNGLLKPITIAIPYKHAASMECIEDIEDMGKKLSKTLNTRYCFLFSLFSVYLFLSEDNIGSNSGKNISWAEVSLDFLYIVHLTCTDYLPCLACMTLLALCFTFPVLLPDSERGIFYTPDFTLGRSTWRGLDCQTATGAQLVRALP